MKSQEMRFRVTLALAVLISFLLVGFVGWRVHSSIRGYADNDQTSISSDQESTSPKRLDSSTDAISNDAPVHDAHPAGWVTYKNEEYGFRFDYPSVWGEVQVSEVFYGSEVVAGPARLIKFSGCNGCDPPEAFPLGLPPNIGVASRDFGGVGTSRPTPTWGGYTKNNDGTYTLHSRQPRELSPSPGLLEVSETNDMLFVREAASELHNVDVSYLVVNLSNAGTYTGLTFIVDDKVGETRNAELLKAIAKTIVIH